MVRRSHIITRVTVVVAGFVTLLGACAPTTYETSATTTVVAATTTIPTGPADELLPRLRQTMLTLSSYIGPNSSGSTTSGKNEVLAEIEALWSAVETEVTPHQLLHGAVTLGRSGAFHLFQHGGQWGRGQIDHGARRILVGPQAVDPP